MKKPIRLLLILTIVVGTFMGCGKSTNDAIPASTSEDNTRFKLVNLKYSLDDSNYYNLRVVCDTKTTYLYLMTSGNGGGISPYNRPVINKNGEVVPKQYTLEELQNENKKQETTNIQLSK